MLAGGMGNIRRGQVEKKPVPPGALIVQIGGPALRIGLGGGAASSMVTGSNDEALDFDSVQRGNAEVERRCQEVIDACVALGDRNPILSIHDIGARPLQWLPRTRRKDRRHLRSPRRPHEEHSMNPWRSGAAKPRSATSSRSAPRRASASSLCARGAVRSPSSARGPAMTRASFCATPFRDSPIDMDIRCSWAAAAHDRDVPIFPAALKPLD
jgi:phosphoribosylformylglycinamidine synthase